MPSTIYIPNTISIDYEDLAVISEDTSRPGSGDSTRTRVLRCLWPDRVQLIQELVGNIEQDNDGNTLVTQPAEHPDWPGFYAKSISTVSAGQTIRNGDPRNSAFDFADLQVSYDVSRSTLGGAAEDDPILSLVEETIESANEFLTLPVTGLYWGQTNGGAFVPTEVIQPLEAPAKHITMLNWKINYRALPQVPSWVLGLLGTTNADPVISNTLGLAFGEETLLFSGFSVGQTTFSSGAAARSLSLNILYRNTGWNKFFRGNTDEPEFIYTEDGTIYRIYPRENYGNLVVSL